MPKIRVIPVLLTDGYTLVKGSQFESWRSTGTVEQAVRLFAMRDVDELILLDVNSRSKNKTINLDLVERVSSILRIPFGVGGGISNVDQAASILRAGAEKVVIGSLFFENIEEVKLISDRFGRQAVVIAIDVVSREPLQLSYYSGKQISSMSKTELTQRIEYCGAGEILLQSVRLDGTMTGMDYELIQDISGLVRIPTVASSGAGAKEDFLKAVNAGASAVAAGSIFQFTHLTPKEVRRYLESESISVRVSNVQ